MTERTSTFIAEEVIFYLDLPSDYLSKDFVIKVVKNFIESKKKYSVGSSFGLVMLQEEYNPVFVYDQTEVEVLTSVIDVKWETRPRNQSYIENGLFEVLSYIFSRSRVINKIYRVMVISDTPTERSDDYYQAVYNLIVKSKSFSTFIDFIRIGDSDYYADDIKIRAITSETHGGTFFCNINQLIDVLSSLVKNKQDFNVIRPEEDQVMEKDKDFYEKLAVDLISLDADDEEICDICQFELCPICGAYSDEIHKCFNCSSRFHSCCAARYSITNNIGFRHIFRCPKCQNLLKLDEEFVDLIYEEEFEGVEPVKELVLQEANEYSEPYESTEEQPVQEIIQEQPVEEIVEEQPLENFEDVEITLEDLDEQIKMADNIIETISPVEEKKEYLEEIPLETEEYIEEEQTTKPIVKPLESIRPPEPIKEELDIEKSIEEIKMNLSLEEIPPPPPIQKKVRIGGYFGHEVDINAGKKAKQKPIKIIEPQFAEETKSITELKPPPRKRAKLKFCKICGASVMNVVVCPKCGAQIE